MAKYGYNSFFLLQPLYYVTANSKTVQTLKWSHSNTAAICTIYYFLHAMHVVPKMQQMLHSVPADSKQQ